MSSVRIETDDPEIALRLMSLLSATTTAELRLGTLSVVVRVASCGRVQAHSVAALGSLEFGPVPRPRPFHAELEVIR